MRQFPRKQPSREDQQEEATQKQKKEPPRPKPVVNEEESSVMQKDKKKGPSRPKPIVNEEESSQMQKVKKKEPPRPKAVVGEEEGSVMQQVKKKKNEEEKSVVQNLPKKGAKVEEESSLMQQPRKKATKVPSKIAKAPAVPPEVEICIEKFMKHSIDNSVEALRDEFKIVSDYVPSANSHVKCCANQEKSRCPDYPCLDQTRIVLQPGIEARENENDFIHANRVVIDKGDREFIAAQAPKETGIEDFWKLVFQEMSPAIILLCAFYEDGKQKCEEFWPLETGGYKYYGKMFINNKKVEHVEQYTIYTLEVLPEGCSNSLITRLAHCSTWPDNGVATSGRMVLRIVKWLKTIEAGPATVVSSSGTGRAGTYIAIDAAVAKLLKGADTNLQDLVLEIRRQRAFAVANELQYLFIYSTVLDYIRAKLPKYTAAVTKFFAAIRSVSNG